MGIMFTNAALMAKAQQAGVCFDNILTIGHSTLYIPQHRIEQLAARYGRDIDAAALARQQYADTFLTAFFDAKSVRSLDCSDYEKCDIVHDMNHPVDPCYHDAFDVVIDGGSLEHVFNFPVAIANCMRMVKVGGSLFLFTMANNHAGHGFYQFSPELFFRIFQPENGFEIRDVILELHRFPGGELSHKTQCFSVADPAAVKTRVGLVSKSPAMLMVHAVKTETRPIFATFPIQSDYSSIHTGGDESQSAQNNNATTSAWRRIARQVFRSLPTRLQNVINGQRQLWHYSLSNGQFYQRWDPL